MGKTRRPATSGVPLNLGGQQVLPDQFGNYSVTVAQMGQTRVRSLPFGARLVFMYPWLRSSNKEMVRLISVVNNPNGSALAFACHGKSLDVWSETVDVKKYMLIAESLLRRLATTRGDFTVHLLKVKRTRIDLHFRKQVVPGSYQEIKREVRDIVEPALRPLEDFVERTNVESIKHFGI